jgi:uncharacterized alkaline shock family protein YloU
MHPISGMWRDRHMFRSSPKLAFLKVRKRQTPAGVIMPTVETVGPLCKRVGKEEHTMTERRARGRQRQQQERPPLQTERGNTTISDVVVSQVAGIAAQEVEGVQMGGGTADAARGFWDSLTGGSGQARGVTVEVGQVECAVELTMAVQYGKSIPQIAEAVRRNVIDRVENLVGLQATEVNITVTDIVFPQERPELES